MSDSNIDFQPIDPETLANAALAANAGPAPAGTIEQETLMIKTRLAAVEESLDEIEKVVRNLAKVCGAYFNVSLDGRVGTIERQD